jgi:hypothetical protein
MTPNAKVMIISPADAGTVHSWKKPMNENTRERWLAKLAKLKIDMKGSPAPHKPLLLLVIIELADQGLLPLGMRPLTPELAFRFCTYWTIVAHRRPQKPDVRYPFHHIKSGGFWSARGEDRCASPDRRLTRFAALVAEFEACLADPAFREEACEPPGVDPVDRYGSRSALLPGAPAAHRAGVPPRLR